MSQERTKTPLTVTHDGEPLVIIYPATPQPQRPAFGAIKGSGEILGDIIASVIPATTWEALQ
ncbi:type II toxin-antitoxin system Phd/YefM family antitoxin [Cylindrospermum sp. FACHB-282]|uniref:type II toxin-antitoxin system Phd/YefM family antitoxin n=1 Tax=Cylindrospermum sp. FACHB-282 TaxID=2692794 RepID=UPI0016838DE1|nr:type II toxin-antitoxin system Phd/YefM family antitoxin [Cylindrospermum sp. FACHB-282]MBD2388734.1 type II toxin-antitoxin system Phd/YefM family antitoxin [Cylindrospermum sp. FACHB-282]